MEDTAKTDLVIKIAELLDDHKGNDTVVLDIRGICSWTDFFIISTVTSQAHLKGLLKHIKGFLSSQEIETLHRQKNLQEEGWILIDCGEIVIHLMDEEMREFYELEKLWHSGDIIYHSSKSS